jgi:hypothetical protein
MLARLALTGLIFLAGTPVMAQNAVIPPAPSRDDVSIPSPQPEPPAPPTPGLKPARPAIPSVPPAVDKPAGDKPANAAAPASSQPKTVAPAPVSPATVPPAPVPNAPEAASPPAGTLNPAPVVSSPAASSAIPSSQPADENWSGNSWNSVPSPTLTYQPQAGTVSAAPAQYNTFSTNGQPRIGASFAPYPGQHDRYPYYSYRRPWYSPGPISHNVNIIW